MPPGLLQPVTSVSFVSPYGSPALTRGPFVRKTPRELGEESVMESQRRVVPRTWKLRETPAGKSKLLPGGRFEAFLTGARGEPAQAWRPCAPSRAGPQPDRHPARAAGPALKHALQLRPPQVPGRHVPRCKTSPFTSRPLRRPRKTASSLQGWPSPVPAPAAASHISIVIC